MVRRWSRVNNLNLNLIDFKVFKKNFKVRIFKSSVSFKKFTKKFTKFKRKTLVKFKHNANWLIYTNVIKFWLKDFMFNKHYHSYQYFNKIHLNSLFVLNFNFVKNTNKTYTNNLNYFYSVLIKKSYKYFHLYGFKYPFNTSLAFVWYQKNLEPDNHNIAPYVGWGDKLYVSTFKKKHKFNMDKVNPILFNLSMYKVLEVRKTLISLVYFSFTKIKNVKLICL